MTSSRLVIEWVALCVMTCLLAVLLNLTQAGQRADNYLYDMAIRASTGSEESTADTLIVAIDNHSIEQVGPWPWSRPTLARLIAELSDAGARVVIVDVLLPEPREGDQALADAITQSGRVVLPIGVEIPGYDGAPYALIEPTPLLANASHRQGHASVMPDQDGVIRSVDRVLSIKDQRIFHAAVTAAKAFPAGNRGQNDIGAEGQDNLRLRFFAQPGDFPTVSASEVLQGHVPPSLVKGRDVIIGSLASGLGDTYATPLGTDSQNLAGVELMASALIAERQGDWIETLNPGTAAIVALIVLAPILLAFQRLNSGGILIVSGLSLAGLAILSLFLLQAGWWIIPTPAAIALLFATMAWTWRRLRFVDRTIHTELLEFTKEPAGDDGSHALLRDPLERSVALIRLNLTALQRKQGTLESLVRNLPEPTICMDRTGQITLTNEAAEQLFVRLGIDQAPANIQALDRYFLSDTVDNHSYDEEHAEGSGLPKGADSRQPALAITADGELVAAEEVRTRQGFWFVTAAQEIENPTGWVLTFSEITQIKQSVAARERSLQFLSHDLRSPIGAAVALIEKSTVKRGLPAVPDQLVEAQRYLRHAMSMAENHVLLTKAEEAGLRSQIFDLASCAQEAVDQAEALARDAGVELVEDYPNDPVEVRGDPAAVARSIENLLRNALAHGSKPGQTITVRVRQKGRIGEISVLDCSKETVTAIRKALASYAKTGQLSRGIGLGLAYCQTVVGKCSGSLEVVPTKEGKSISLRLRIA